MPKSDPGMVDLDELADRGSARGSEGRRSNPGMVDLDELADRGSGGGGSMGSGNVDLDLLGENPARFLHNIANGENGQEVLLGGEQALSSVVDMVVEKIRGMVEFVSITEGADWPEVAGSMSRLLAPAFGGEVWPPLTVNSSMVDNSAFNSLIEAVLEASKAPLPLGEDTLAAACSSLHEEVKGQARTKDPRVDKYYMFIRGRAIAPPANVDEDSKDVVESPLSSPRRFAVVEEEGLSVLSEDLDAPLQADDMDEEPDRRQILEDVGDLNVSTFDLLELEEELQTEALAAWTAFLTKAKTTEAAGELVYAALFESAPSIQALFTSPRAVQGLRFIMGLQSFIGAINNPPQLKLLVEALAFGHLNLDVTGPRVFIFRDAILDLFQSELGAAFTDDALKGWHTLLNYIGGAIIFVKHNYADRIKLLVDSWKLANNKDDAAALAATQGQAGQEEEEEEEEEEVKQDQDDGKQKTRWEKMKDWGRQRSGGFGIGSGSSELLTGDVQGGSGDKGDKENPNAAAEQDGIMMIGGADVPTTYAAMFEFNATVMGFGKYKWLWEVNNSFDDMVRNVGSSGRLQEECEVLALRISKITSVAELNLGQYRSVMLAALRQMLPKTWDPRHETAWNWLWENVQRILGDVIMKPGPWETALQALLQRFTEDEKETIRLDVYTRVFQLAPQAQDFFKQSNTRLMFIAGRVMEMTGELFADPWGMTELISAIGLRHVGYGIPTELVGPFVSCWMEVVSSHAPGEEDELACEAFRWSLTLIAKILVRVINEGSTIVMKAINANSAAGIRKAVACAPRAERAMWVLRIQVGTQQISPLSWSIESGSLMAAKVMIEDLFTIRADREKYYYGNDALFTTHTDIVERLCADALQLLPTLLDGLIWRSKRSVNGARRVNFYVKWLIVTQEGTLAGALKALAESHDVKIISHPVIVLMSDTLWSGVVRRQFIVSKLGFLFSLTVFMLCQAILPKTGSSDDVGIRWSIFIGRLVNYSFSLPRLVLFHVSRSKRAYKVGSTFKVGRFSVPMYLKDADAKMGVMLLLLLFGMCVSEPLFYCASQITTTGPTEDCDDAETALPYYTLLSMGAMVLHWLLLIDLSVFSTKLAAFVLVCKHVLNEVGKFLVAMIFILVTFSCAIASLRHDTLEFSTVPKCACCLFAVTVGLYEGDYRELTHQPALLTPVLLFVTVSVILLINLLIAQLNCSYDYVYADMLGFARLNRADIIVDTMTSCPPNRWNRFVAGLRFEQLLEFDEGDVGLAGGIQIREPASQNPISHDIIQRFGGSSSPEMQWPQDDEIETDRYSRIKSLIAQINKKAEAGRSKGGDSSLGKSGSKDVEGGGSSVDSAGSNAS